MKIMEKIQKTEKMMEMEMMGLYSMQRIKKKFQHYIKK